MNTAVGGVIPACIPESDFGANAKLLTTAGPKAMGEVSTQVSGTGAESVTDRVDPARWCWVFWATGARVKNGRSRRAKKGGKATAVIAASERMLLAERKFGMRASLEGRTLAQPTDLAEK